MVERIQQGLFTLDSAENLGAIEIATFLGLILLGFALSQAYTFFRQSKDDKWWLKCLVSGLLFLEITHTLAACMDIYLETVLHPGRNEANSYPLSVNALTENIITFIVQWFFSWRIYRLSKRFPLSLACSSLAALRFIGAVVISVQSFLDVQQKPNGVFVFTFRWLITSALAVGVLADILIAASMIFYLQQLSSPMNRRWTTETLNHLVLWTLETGLTTSLTSLAVIITFITSTSLIWLGLYIVLAKLYSISLLVSLNNRTRSRRKEDVEEIRISTIRFSNTTIDEVTKDAIHRRQSAVLLDAGSGLDDAST